MSTQNVMNEWIEWNGGGCPVEPSVFVEYECRNGYGSTRQASAIEWEHYDIGDDIIRYREFKYGTCYLEKSNTDSVNHPKHYTSHPSGVECIQITEHMGFNLGNAVKYIWRADLKADAIEDLKKARWYIDRELKKRGAE